IFRTRGGLIVYDLFFLILKLALAVFGLLFQYIGITGPICFILFFIGKDIFYHFYIRFLIFLG
ncbi:MAG: hypothetical protein ABF502_12060, partial [Acetobacter sp.]|uniref:hypothetical protein n=1 Tax=Acetobacter sp. TaxID=440 RepID=UPI0039E8A5D4